VSGMLSALAYLQVRALGQMGEPEYRVVFYFSLTGVVAGLLGALASGENILLHQHSGKGFALL
jgi:S-adenosylmethionine uptake transporter